MQKRNKTLGAEEHILRYSQESYPVGVQRRGKRQRLTNSLSVWVEPLV